MHTLAPGKRNPDGRYRPIETEKPSGSSGSRGRRRISVQTSTQPKTRIRATITTQVYDASEQEHYHSREEVKGGEQRLEGSGEDSKRHSGQRFNVMDSRSDEEDVRVGGRDAPLFAIGRASAGQTLRRLRRFRQPSDSRPAYDYMDVGCFDCDGHYVSSEWLDGYGNASFDTFHTIGSLHRLRAPVAVSFIGDNNSQHFDISGNQSVPLSSSSSLHSSNSSKSSSTTSLSNCSTIPTPRARAPRSPLDPSLSDVEALELTEVSGWDESLHVR